MHHEPRIAALFFGPCAFVGISLFASTAFGAPRPAARDALTVHFPRVVQAGRVSELRVHESWPRAGRAFISLIRLDGIRDWTGTAFGADGYDSRMFCDEDNVARVVSQTGKSIVWATGTVGSEECEVRLFFVPHRAGTFLARVHFLTGPIYTTLTQRALTAHGRETDVSVKVRSAS
jgi:hypothetical protein